MGKLVMKYLVFALTFFILTGNAWAAENVAVGQDLEKRESRIEQVYINRPEITVYGAGLSEVDGLAEYFLGQEPLEWMTSMPFSESGEGIYYYVLLDVSGSMPQSYFKSVKDGILNLKKEMKEKDRLILCSFGEQIKTYGDGSQTEEELKMILDELSAKDQKTLLFEGIDRVADMASKVPASECMRKVLVVISDGEDIAVGQKMSQEALVTLKETGIPAYAVCISDTGSSNINSFGEFARTSGGELLIFSVDEGKTVLSRLHESLYSNTRIRLKTSYNIVSNQKATFSIKLPKENLALTKEVMDLRWIPDTIAPELISVSQQGDRQLALTLNEPVEGVDNLGNYIVMKGDTPISVSGVSLEKSSDTQIILTMAEAFTDGEYTVSCKNIKDKSMERNAVGNTFTVSLTGSEEPVSVQNPSPSHDYSGLLFLLLLALMVLIIVLAVRYKKIKEGKGILYIDGKPVLASEVEVRQHVAVSQEDKIPLHVQVAINGKKREDMTWHIGSSLIIGRADICDIYFDDKKMSRQHFALEREQDTMYIIDLQTTNGTMVNGIRIHGKRRLEREDNVLAGSMEIIIRW